MIFYYIPRTVPLSLLSILEQVDDLIKQKQKQTMPISSHSPFPFPPAPKSLIYFPLLGICLF